jgi:O-antigen biosynthesis protein
MRRSLPNGARVLISVRDFLGDQQVLRAPDGPRSPAVSVVLPTYNRGRTGQLESAIRSVLRQTFADLELIVVDDGSRDGSFQLIQRLQASDPRVVHVRHERNSGIHILRTNEGIELARGRYVAFQFDDDHWRPRALELLVDKMRASSSSCCVTVGKAEYTSRAQAGSFLLPQGGVSFALLHESNRIANNAVLVPRELFDRYGMYDCHIGMRRLCDWDLWLRLIQHVEFLLVDEIISDVSICNPGAIGLTVPYDLPLFRYFTDIHRDQLLTPARWHEYEVDSRRVGEVELGREVWRRLYEEQIAPYYCKFRHLFPAVDGFPSSAPRERKELLYFGSRYDPRDDAAFGPYDARSRSWTAYQAHFQYGSQLSSRWMDESDVMLMLRPHQDDERAVMEQGLASGRPMGVYLDDDFVTLHEYGPPFDFMAPGTPGRHNLLAMLERADTVWVTNRFIADSVQPFNPRIVPHALAIEESALPTEPAPRPPGTPRRLGYIGTSYRLEEFRLLWEALVRLSAEYGERLEFEFWGLDVSSLPPLSSPVRQVPYETSYVRFLHRLSQARFDLLLNPLLDTPRPRLAKNAHKYFHVAVAGAVGVFSRVPPYDQLPEGLTCLKADNTPADWYRVLREAVDMPAERFDRMRRRTLEHVREEFTAAAQIHLHEAAWRATEFHATTRAARSPDGRPRVLYALGTLDDELELRLDRWLRLGRQYGVDPVVVLRRELVATPAGRRLAQALAADGIACESAAFDAVDEHLRALGSSADGERRELRALLERVTPALVHSLGLLPLVGEVCATLGLPHVASLYAVDDHAQWHRAPDAGTHCAVLHSDTLRYAAHWQQGLGTDTFCAREAAAPESFALGLRRHLEALGTPPPPPHGGVRVVVAGALREQGGQLETLAAVAQLALGPAAAQIQWPLELWGDPQFDPEYVRRCRERIEAEGLGARVHIADAPPDLLGVLSAADILLSPARSASLPVPIKEAMALGALVVATPVGGVPEIVIDGVTGLLCTDPSPEAIRDALTRAIQLPPDQQRRMRTQARRVARSEFHPQRGASDLFELYNRAIAATRGSRPPVPPPPEPPASATHPRPAERLEQPAHPPASHVRLHAHLTYRLVPRRPHWHGLDVLVGTHQQPARGRLALHVLSAPGHVVRTATVDLATARDNDWLPFHFPPIANAAGRPFLLRFSLAHPSPPTKLSLYDTAANATRLPARLLRRLGLHPPRESLYCRLRYAVTRAD